VSEAELMALLALVERFEEFLACDAPCKLACVLLRMHATTMLEVLAE